MYVYIYIYIWGGGVTGRDTGCELQLLGHADARAVQLADKVVVLTPSLGFSASRLAGQNLALTVLRP